MAVGLSLSATAAMASVALGAPDLSSLKTSLDSALQNAHGDASAQETAISQTTQSAISQYGSEAASSITSAVLSDAEASGASCQSIGGGLAQAAVSESGSDASAASNIASTVANEGRSCEIKSFQAKASLLGNTELAQIAGGEAAPTGGLGGGLTGGGTGYAFSGGFPGGGGGGGGGGGCLNPSCTKL
jgi:hypothetical protein